MILAGSFMARRGGRLTGLGVFFALAAFFLTVTLSVRAEAQALTIFASKTLCDAATCPPGPPGPPGTGLGSVAPGVPVFYRIRIQNVGSSPGAVAIADTLPAGFHLVGAECGPTTGPFTSVQSAGGSLVGVAVAAGAWVDCRLHGYFNGSATQADNKVDIFEANGGVRLFSTIHRATNVDLHAPLPANLSVAKEIVDPAPNGSGVSVLDVSTGSRIVTYRITITNHGPSDLYLGSLFELQDQLSLLPSGVGLTARFVSATCTIIPAQQLAPGSDCLASTPSRLIGTGAQLIAGTGLQDFAAWRYPANGPGSDGFLRSGDKIVLEVRVEIAALRACMNVAGADGILETAHIELAVPAAPGGHPTVLAETASASNPQPALDNTASVPLSVVTGASQVDPNCDPPPYTDPPSLQIDKIQSVPTPVTTTLAWATTQSAGPYAEYLLRLTNLSPTRRIRNIHLVDTVRPGVGTPSFRAYIFSVICPAPTCALTIPGQPALVSGYGNPTTMATGSLYGGSSTQGLARFVSGQPPPSVTVRIGIRYLREDCDSLQSAFDPIDNIVRVAQWDEVAPDGTVTTVHRTLSSMVTTHMVEGPVCPLEVRKRLLGSPPPDRIQFGVPVTYEVIFGNPSNSAVTVGTMIDTLRYTAAPGTTGPYAAQLRIDYSYTCAPLPPSGTITGYPAHNPAGAGSTDTVFAAASQFAQQGVKLINGGPVTFASHSSLRCLVTLTVTAPSPPPSADPYCASALLENAAILDLSRFYNSNLWPGDPSLWASVGNPLPDCYNWVIVKDVTPGAATWIWQGGGPLSWTYTVTNLGPPMTVNVANIRDWFTWGPSTSPNPSTPLAVTVSGGGVQCNGGNCSPNPTVVVNPATSTPAGTSVLDPVSLGTGDRLAVTIDVANAPAMVGPGNLICNNVEGFLLTPPAPGNAYWKNPQTLAAQSCIPVLATAGLTLRKTIVNPNGVTVPHSFEVALTCTPYPLTPSTYQIPVSGTTGATTIPRVPVGDHCSMSETPPPALSPTSGCAFPVWDTTYLPPGPITIVGSSGSNQLTAVNTVRCAPVGSLAIHKDTIGPTGVAYPSAVTVDVDCGPYGPHHVPFQAVVGQTRVLGNIPVSSVCALVEQLPPPAPSGCGWTAQFDPAGPVTIPASGGQVQVSLHNRWSCGGLLIFKRTWVDGQPAPTSPLLLPFAAPPFPVRVTCGQGSVQVSLNAGNNFTVQVPAASGSSCTVEETPPPFSWGVIQGCTWAPFYTPGQQTVYVSGQPTIEILNRQYCHGLFPL